MNFRKQVLLSALTISILSACSKPLSEEETLSLAEQNIEAGKIAEASINIKNVIKENPQNAQARLLLGKLYFEQSNFLSAEKELSKAVELAPTLDEAILTLAHTQLTLNRFDDALNTLKNRTFSNQSFQVKALFIEGRANLSLNQLDEAKTKIAEAKALSEDAPYSLLGSALILSYEEKYTEALDILDVLVANNNDFLEAWLLKGSIHSNIEEFDKAAKAYLTYFEKQPENFGIRTLVAHNLIRAGEFEQAKVHVDALRSINDNHPTINLLASQIAYFEENYALAKELSNMVSNQTNNGLAQMISGLSSFNLGEDEQAYYQLNAIADSLPRDHQVNKVLAILQVKLGYEDELSSNLASLAESSGEDAYLYSNIGRELVNKGDSAAAKEMFEKARNLAPSDAQLHTNLGIFKLSTNDKSGTEELTKALEIDPNSVTANIALAMGYLKNNEPQKAQEIASKWLADNPESVAALILNGNVALRSNKTDSAKDFFIRAYELDRSNIVPLYNLAVIATDGKDYQASNDYLDKIFETNLEYPYAYRLAITNALAENKSESLEKKLSKLIEDAPGSVWPRITLARRYVIENKPNDAAELLGQLSSYEELPVAFFYAYANALKKSQQLDEIPSMYKKWQTAQSDNESAYLGLINHYDSLNEYQKALEESERALSISKFSRSFQFLSLQAYYLLATSQFESAAKKIDSLARSHKDDAFVMRLQGQLEMARGNYQAAVPFLKQSFDLKKNKDTALFLAISYKNSNQVPEAIAFLETQLQSSPNLYAYQSLLAELYISNSPEKAIANYKQLIQQVPNNVIALNNIAWIYHSMENYDEALTYVEKAVKLAPNNVQVLDTLAVTLTSTGQYERAIDTLKKAIELKPSNKELVQHLIAAYKANNQPQLADELEQQTNNK